MPSGESSAQGLLEDWPPFDEVLDPINRVFLPRADIATDTLVAGLQKMGWEVDDVTAYRTVRAAPPAAEIREAIKGGGSSVGLSGDMPDWSIDLTDDEIHDLVAFVRTFCKK